MSTPVCKHCGGELKEEAPICPHCSIPLLAGQHKSPQKRFAVFFVFVVLFCLFMIYWLPPDWTAFIRK